MTVESPEDLTGLLKVGRVVGLTLRAMERALRPGITTAALDQIAQAVLTRHGARSAPLLTYDFPGTTCISINDEAAHGIPGNRQIQPGDLVKLDVSAELNGYFADAAVTVAVPPTTLQLRKLCACARAALTATISAARAGQPLSEIGLAAETTVDRYGFRVVRELPGHGVGRALHEPPTIWQVLMPDTASNGVPPLAEGTVITLEPHITTGTGQIDVDRDGWTLRTRDGGPVAAYEHTVVVTRSHPILITAL